MKISIITPSMNQAEFIERTIQSVISQNHELEYVIIDGGSTDHTIELLQQYQDKLVWKSETDNGQSHAVNKGLQVTSGDIIGWLNSDDIYFPGTIKKVIEFFKINPDVDVVYGDAYLINRSDKKIGFYPTEPWNLERLKDRCFISQPAAFFKRDLIEKHGFLSEALHYCMDYEFWLRLGLANVKFAYLPEVLAGARIYDEAKSFRYCLEAGAEANTVLKNKLGYIPASRLVSYSGAKVKSTSGLSYPSLKFIISVWMKLWETTGLYYNGSQRIHAWVGAQQAMLKEFSKRSFDSYKKKLRY